MEGHAIRLQEDAKAAVTADINNQIVNKVSSLQICLFSTKNKKFWEIRATGMDRVNGIKALSVLQSVT